MIRFFIKIYILFILLVFLVKWTVETILFNEVYSDRYRVIAGLSHVHLDRLHFFAEELAACDPHEQGSKLADFRKQSIAPIELRPTAELSPAEQARLETPDGFIHSYSDGMVDYLGVSLNKEQYLLFGPVGHLTNEFIEHQVNSWMKDLREAMESSEDPDETLGTFSSRIRVPVRLQPWKELPASVFERMPSHRDSLFYQSGEDHFVVIACRDPDRAICMGPLPKVTDFAQVAARKGMLAWFLAASGILGFMVIQVAYRFRRIENAAGKIAEGDYTTRVDASKLGEAQKLATAFNTMAARTESMIRSQRELLQVVSHELRTPISRLRFAVAVIPTPQMSEDQYSPMPIIRQSIDDMEAIVEVLFYVRNEQVAELGTRDWITINLALDSLLTSLQLEYRELKIEMTFSDSDSAKKVFADRRSLLRVFDNLTSNAVRHAKSALQIHVYEVTEEIPGAVLRRFVCIDVEDDGTGIPEDMRTEIIKPFVRIEPQTELREQRALNAGLGLGLAIVDRILQQHGGSLQIDRGASGGCLVRTRWPLEDGITGRNA
jgi:two-component system sensor histidine kinase RstB